ncbi:hypothetical protein [Burkholderia gladioli]|uniref:HEPN AbiU2-like domain-containing protein n=1 Tax=Burkholderia gladioli TaxID=28095 RepID=A0AB38TLE6_BURGA|nr:hypothetical protein [Burkholderia gladioli]UWX69167.1 hypothetical protein NYZ96_13190 [Burkholderia gladioli]
MDECNDKQFLLNLDKLGPEGLAVVRENLRKLATQLARRLNGAYYRLKYASSPLARQWGGVELQFHVFEYELIADLNSLFYAAPYGFARTIAVKRLLHNAVEFNKHINESIIPEMIRILADKGIEFSTKDIQESRREWRSVLDELERWRPIRNKATAHFDSDVPHVVELLEGLDSQKVVDSAIHFWSFTLSVLAKFHDAAVAAKLADE